jgi:hypothetical protein
MAAKKKWERQLEAAMRQRQADIDAGRVSPDEPWSSGVIIDEDSLAQLRVDLAAASSVRRRRGR